MTRLATTAHKGDNNMTATYTFDVFSTLDGYGSYGPDGDWGGYSGKQGPEQAAGVVTGGVIRVSNRRC